MRNCWLCNTPGEAELPSSACTKPRTFGLSLHFKSPLHNLSRTGDPGFTGVLICRPFSCRLCRIALTPHRGHRGYKLTVLGFFCCFAYNFVAGIPCFKVIRLDYIVVAVSEVPRSKVPN